MISPLPLPDWVPWWANLATLIAGLLFALMFLLMPFAVFGVKSRLDALEARLDEIQGEIRSLSLRLPEPGLRDDAGVPGRRRRARPGAYAGSADPDGPAGLNGNAGLDSYLGSDGYTGPEGYPGSDDYPGSDGYTGPQPPIPPAPRHRKPPAMPPRTEPRLY